jgi:cytoskeletal protein CcmA (bactofilin family)
MGFGIGNTFDRKATTPSHLAEEKRTLVEEGTIIKGSLTSTCPIVVKGRIEGEVNAPSLHVSTSGSVHGKVKVAELKSAGELSGDFDADVVQLSGKVKDKTVIRGKSLEVKLVPPNGKMEVVFGDCNLEIGEPPTKEEAIRAASGKSDGKSDGKAETKAEAKEAKEAAKEAKAEASASASIPPKKDGATDEVIKATGK